MSTFTSAVFLLALTFLLCEAGESKTTGIKTEFYHSTEHCKDLNLAQMIDGDHLSYETQRWC